MNEPTAVVPLCAEPAAPAVSSRAPASPSRGPVLAVCATLIVLTLAVFAQTCRFEFVNYDDNIAVYENPFVRAGLTLKGLIWAFTPNNYEYWIPLTNLSHMVDAQIFGAKAGGHHMTNVLLHAATAVVLFLALRRLTGAFWRSAFVAAVFAIHPLRAESVAWVTERKDVLAGLFFVLALFFYGGPRGATGPTLRTHVAVIVCFLLGFVCKPMVITLPFLLLLLDYWPGGRIQKLSDWKKPVLEKLPMLLMVPFLAVLTVVTQGHAPGALQTLEDNSIAARAANALLSCVIYIKQTFYPLNLVVFYSRSEEHHAAWEAVAAAAVLAAITAIALVYRRKLPFLLCGWFWYLGMLVPVIGIVSIGHMAHADRYTYFPQIGVLIMVAWGAAEWFGNWASARTILAALAIGAVAVLAGLGFRQTSSWRNSEALWNHTLAVKPKSLLAHNNLATVLYAKRDINGALAHLDAAVEINPKFALAQNNLGMILANTGHVDEAIGHFEMALAEDPNSDEAHNNFGAALRKQGKLDEAIAHLKKATEINPTYALAWYNLGRTLLVKGDFARAADGYLRGMEIQPDFVANPAVQKDIYQIAWALATSPDASVRDGAKAVRLAEQGYLQSKGGGALVLTALAAGYAESGQFQNAVSTAQRALQVAQQQGDSGLSAAIQDQLKLYEAKRPFHEAPKQ